MRDTSFRAGATDGHVAAREAINAKGIAGCTGSGVGTPCSITRGMSAGNALAACTSLPGPVNGPNHAVFASTANATASRHKPKAKVTRDLGMQAVELPNICAVYHVVMNNLSAAVVEMRGAAGCNYIVRCPYRRKGDGLRPQLVQCGSQARREACCGRGNNALTTSEPILVTVVPL